MPKTRIGPKLGSNHNLGFKLIILSQNFIQTNDSHKNVNASKKGGNHKTIIDSNPVVNFDTPQRVCISLSASEIFKIYFFDHKIFLTNMIFIYFFLILSGGGKEYTRPKWKQLLELMKNPKYSQAQGLSGRLDSRSTISWGKPQTGSFISYKLCPALELPPGADRLFCNGSTCVVECKPGTCWK